MVWNPENLGNMKEYGEKGNDFSIVHNKRHLKNSRKPEVSVFGHRKNIRPNRLKTKGDGLHMNSVSFLKFPHVMSTMKIVAHAAF